MSEMRRQKMFDDAPPMASRWRLARIAALVVCSALLGVAGVKAAEGWEASWERELVIAEAEINAELMRARLDLAREFLSERSRQSETGTAEPDSVAMAELELARMEEAMITAMLDLEESMQTGKSARNELYAPVVDGRDFVTERLEARLKTAMQQMRTGRIFNDMARRRVESGTAPTSYLRGAEQELQRARAEADDLTQQLALRQEYLSGESDPRQIEASLRLSSAQSRVERAMKRLKAAREERDELAARHEVGAASRLELKQAEYQLLEIEAEARLAELEYDFLQRRAEAP